MARETGQQVGFVAADLITGLAAVRRVSDPEPADGGPADESVRLLPEVEDHDRPAGGAPEDGSEPLRGELPAPGGLELLEAGRERLVPVELGHVGRGTVVARQTRVVVRVDDQGRFVGGGERRGCDRDH